jgi:hypothetical protein
MGPDRFIHAQRRYVLHSLIPQKIAFGVLTIDYGHTQDQVCFSADGLMEGGAPSGPPDVIGFDPNRMRQTDDRASGKGSEITSVQTVWDVSVDEKQLVVAELSAAAPERQGAVLTVAQFRARDLPAGHKDLLIQPANFRAGQRRHVLQQQRVDRQVAAGHYEARDDCRSLHGEKIADLRRKPGLDPVEPDGLAGAGVPDQSRRGRDQAGDRDQNDRHARH